MHQIDFVNGHQIDFVNGHQIDFVKGHGTQNDFVIIPDLDGQVDLTAADVAAICDRRAGIGADGVLRVVRSQQLSDVDGEDDLWFMDYRNADGSISEMCGNGVRVFAHFLIERGLATGPMINIATRDGVKPTEVLSDGRYRVGMGPVTVADDRVTVRVGGVQAELTAFPADVGNPHAVAFVDDLEALELFRAPSWSPQDRFPDGVNIEFIKTVGPRHIAMRVFERGAGETRSCGTGTCAAAAVAAVRASDQQRPVNYRVDVPGGTVEVELTDQQCHLTGPAEIVAEGTFRLGSRSVPNPGFDL